MTLSRLPSTAAVMASLEAAHPILAAAIRDRPAAETGTTSSIATDGASILVNPGFMASRDEEGRVYMLAFIATMLTNLFIDRTGDRDRTAWSMACNMSIHHQLAELGVAGRPVEAEGVTEADTRGMTADQIYERIMDGRTMVFGKTFRELAAMAEQAVATDPAAAKTVD